MNNAATKPLHLLDLPIEVQEIIYDYYFRTDTYPHAGSKVVQLILGGTKERDHPTVQYPKALLYTCRAIRNIAAPLLTQGLTLDVRSWSVYNLNQIADALPAVYLPRFSELSIRVEAETPHSVDLSKFASLEKATFDLRRVLDSRVYLSLHLPSLETVDSASHELDETLRDWRHCYPHYVEGTMKSSLFEWLHHIAGSTADPRVQAVRVISSYYFDIEIRDCEVVDSQLFDCVRIHFEVTRKLRVQESRNFWDTEMIYVIDPSLSGEGCRDDNLGLTSIQAQNVAQALSQNIAQHYPTMEVKSLLQH